MKLFKITGNTSKIKLRLEHPIYLEGKYSIGLSGFYSDNFVFNLKEDAPYCIGLTENNITLYYGFKKGYYTFEEFKERIIGFIKEFMKDKYKNDFEMNIVSNKIQIKTPVQIIFKAIVIDLIGFDKSQNILEPNKIYLGNRIPKFRPFDVIEIHCNLVEPSFENHDEHSHLHKESEILYSFFPNVAYGSKISEKPNEIDYVPIKNLDKIQNIIITIQDSEGNLLNNNAKSIVYLRLKKE